MWISSKQNPKTNNSYWVTVLIMDEPQVIAANYQDGKWYDSYNYKKLSKKLIKAWWDEGKPEPFNIGDKKEGMEFKVEALNENGNNANIKINVLPDQKMRELGFTDYLKGYWYINKPLVDEDGVEITLNIRINKSDPSDYRIDVLDEDLGQPYDYQIILSKPHYQKNKIAMKVYEEVERWMQEYAECGLIEGHNKGDYI